MATVSPENQSAIAFGADEPTEVVEAIEDDVPPELWFDRSSIIADVMVILEGVSEEDWWKYAPDNRVCEYIDGVVYLPSPASREHQDDVGFWFILIQSLLGETQLGHAVLGPGVLPLGPRKNPEPDVFVVPIGEGPHDPPALLVIETLSKSTRSHDLGRRRTSISRPASPRSSTST